MTGKTWVDTYNLSSPDDLKKYRRFHRHGGTVDAEMRRMKGLAFGDLYDAIAVEPAPCVECGEPGTDGDCCDHEYRGVPHEHCENYCEYHAEIERREQRTIFSVDDFLDQNDGDLPPYEEWLA